MAGRHYVRGHWRNNPVPKAAKPGLWVVVAAGAVLLLIQQTGGGAVPEPGPTAPASAAGLAAARAAHHGGPDYRWHGRHCRRRAGPASHSGSRRSMTV